MIRHVEVEGRGAMVADLPGGYVKVLFDDNGELRIGKPLAAPILFLKKAEQFDLFGEPVNVPGSVRKDGTVVKPYTRIQKKKHEAPPAHKPPVAEPAQPVTHTHRGHVIRVSGVDGGTWIEKDGFYVGDAKSPEDAVNQIDAMENERLRTPPDPEPPAATGVTGLPPDVKLDHPSLDQLREALARGVFNVKVISERDLGGYGKSYELGVLPSDIPDHWQKLDRRGDGSRIEAFDPAFMHVNEEGRASPNSDGIYDRPEGKEPGYIFRGMSFEEYEAARNSGTIKSLGNYNLAGQEGLSYYSLDKSQAASYATGFSPWQFSATPSRPAVIVRVKDPGGHVRVEGTGEDEVGIDHNIAMSEVDRVYFGTPFSVSSGTQEVRTAFQSTVATAGSSTGYSSSVRWTMVDQGAKAPEPEPASREGETKSENGIDYVLKDGHWHRTTPLPDPKEELAEDREDLRTALNHDPHGPQTQELIAKISEKQRAQAEPEAVAADDAPDDLDPNSANYRYRDTGYVAGSRKELAAELIRAARKSGQRLRATDIDWNEIEQNPRLAKELITKSNLFGSVDWEAAKARGMEPAAGFLIDRVYAAVAQEPDEDKPEARKAFALGLETLRDRVEKCTKPDEVTDVLMTIRNELEGVMLSARESEEYQAALAVAKPFAEKLHAMKEAKDAAYQQWMGAKQLHSGLQYEQEKRARRKWKPDPELDAKVAAAAATFAVEDAAYQSLLTSDPKAISKKRDVGGGYTSYDSDYEWEYRQMREKAGAILQASKVRNLAENPMTRAWMHLGPRFLALINYRRYKGSDTFASHVTAAKTGKIKDWSWAEKEMTKKEGGATDRDVRFQLKVAENFERVGGRPTEVTSTAALKSLFGLRDVQSGNWVLRDVNSATFHVQRAAEAFSDLADLMGVGDGNVAMNGRLALAFGARGHGNAGFGGAARAHYEPVQRVINLTKMGGGGALGHEWFHALDNMVSEAEGAGPAGTESYATENPDLLPAGELREAFRNVRDILMRGPHRLPEKIEYNAKDFRTAHYNIDNPRNEITRMIHDAADAGAAIIAVDEHYADHYKPDNKRSEKQRLTWRRLALAYHSNKADGDKVWVKTGASVSAYAYEAAILDSAAYGKYWSSGREMAARAFQSYCEDKLASMDRRNDYLSSMADNKYYKDPIFGDSKPFPEGDERPRFNEAFDRLLAVMKARNTLAKAMQLMVDHYQEQAAMKKIILFFKAEQRDLFDAPVNVKAGVRDGKQVHPYTRGTMRYNGIFDKKS